MCPFRWRCSLGETGLPDDGNIYTERASSSAPTEHNQTISSLLILLGSPLIAADNCRQRSSSRFFTLPPFKLFKYTRSTHLDRQRCRFGRPRSAAIFGSNRCRYLFWRENLRFFLGGVSFLQQAVLLSSEFEPWFQPELFAENDRSPCRTVRLPASADSVRALLYPFAR